MAWSDTTAGFLIQTGTDADFSGLSGLTGVTVTTQGNKQLYTIATDRTIRIDGVLTGDGEFEELITTREVANGSNSCIVIASTGTWNAGKLKSNPGGTTSSTLYTKGTIWRQTGNITGNNWFNGGFASGAARLTGAHLSVAGTLNLNGSTFAGPMMITFSNDAVVNSVYAANILSDDTSRPAGQEWLSRYYQGTTNIGQVDQQGGTIQLEAINSASGNKLTLQRSNAGIGAWSQSGANNLGGVTFDPANPGTNYTTLSFLGSNNVVDFAQYSNQIDTNTNMGATRLQNCPQGTDLDINGGETDAASRQDNWGYTWMTRTIGTNIQSLADQSNQQGAFYIKDYNETGNDRSPSTRVTSIDDSADAIYFGLFNGSLTSLSVTGPYAMVSPNRNSETEILIAVNNLSGGALADPANPLRIRATKNTGIWKWDQRTKSLTLGDDRFDVFFWSYENNHWSLDDNLAGGLLNEAHTYSFLTLPDASITNDRATITALNASLGSNFVVANTSITTGTVSVNLDQVYDLVKYKKETSVANIIIPTTTTLVLDSDGSEIDLKALTITQGTGLWTVGSNHTKVKHDTVLDLSKFTLAGGIELTAPTLSNLPTTVGTSTLNPTNVMTSTGSHTIGSGSIINGALTASGNGNSFGGRITNAVILSSTSTGVNSVSGTMDSTFTSAATSLHTLTGTNTGVVSLTNGTVSTSSDYSGGSTLTASGTGNSTIQGSSTGLVTLGNASSGHTLNAIMTGGFTIGTGVSSFAGTSSANSTAGNGDFAFNGALTGNFTHGTAKLAFGAGASMTGTLTKNGSGNANSLTMTAIQASTIDLVVTSGTLELFVALRADYKSVTGLTHDNGTATTTTFQVGSGLPSGRVIFKNRTSGVILEDKAHTEGTPTTLRTITNNAGSPTNYDIYYKPTNTFGSDGVFWTTTVRNSDNGAVENRTIDVTAVPHAGVLTRAAEDADLTGLTAVMNTITDQTVANITIAGAISQINAPQTQALLLRVTDDANYLNLLANTNAEIDDILPGLQSGSTVNQARFTLQATDQQSITALLGTGTGTLVGTITAGGKTFTAVFIFPNPAGLTEPEAKQACGEALDDRRVTRQNMNNLGILAPINDADPS